MFAEDAWNERLKDWWMGVVRRKEVLLRRAAIFSEVGCGVVLRHCGGAFSIILRSWPKGLGGAAQEASWLATGLQQ